MAGSDEPAHAAAALPSDIVQQVTELANDSAETIAVASESVGEAVEASAEQPAHTRAVPTESPTADLSEPLEEARRQPPPPGRPDHGTAQDFGGRFNAGADILNGQITGKYERATQAMSEFNTKAVEAWRANAEAAIAHWQKLASVTNWSEAIALNTMHARKQIEVITEQTRELSEMAGRIAQETASRLTPKA